MNTLIQCLVLSCIGVLLAWTLRRPLRCLLGPGPAFCLWLLPLLLAGMPCLPAWPGAGIGYTSLLVLPPLAVTPTATAATGAPGGVPWLGIWLGGCVLMVLRLAWHYRRIVHTSRPLPSAMRKTLACLLASRVMRRLRLHPAGPAVLWGPHCRVLLPDDFLERFDAGERAHVLTHEFTHLRRGDPLWSLLGELALAGLWFFPPAWLALSRFRLDQELACDDAVLRRSPHGAASYARSLLDSQHSRRTALAASAWLSRSQLEERLTMIQHHRQTTALRRLGGYASLALLLGATALATHAALPGNAASTTPATATSTSQAAPASVNMAFRARHPPRYPKDAIKHHQQGTVVLRVLVDRRGNPVKTEIAHSSGVASLDQAAVAAAKQWRFQPRMVHGQAHKGWAKVPVEFRLDSNKPNAAAPSSTNSPRVVPASRKNQPPVYPASAIKKDQQGTVMLLVHVDAHGKVLDTKIDKSSGHAALDTAAIRAARKWSYTPGMADGRPQGGWVQVPVTFRLKPLLVLLNPPSGKNQARPQNKQ